jgi:hypothetical protein
MPPSSFEGRDRLSPPLQPVELFLDLVQLVGDPSGQATMRDPIEPIEPIELQITSVQAMTVTTTGFQLCQFSMRPSPR